MKNEEITCDTDLQPDVIEKETFERELALCKRLSHEKGGCSWGICKSCGVIPLLYKLHKGILLESPQEIKEIREKTFFET